MSSTTTNLKNINFMSETRFDNLSEIKDDELYAVKIDNINGDWDNRITKGILDTPQPTLFHFDNDTHTLTIKAGTKVYYPDGKEGTSLQVREYTIPSDITYTPSTTWGTVSFIVYNITQNQLETVAVSSTRTTTDGTTDISPCIAYNSTDNYIKKSMDSGSTWTDQYSFPLMVVSITDGEIKHPIQVFQGATYIGTTVYFRAGYNMRIPNGIDPETKKPIYLNRQLSMNRLVSITGNLSLFFEIDSDDLETQYVSLCNNALVYEQEMMPDFRSTMIWYNPLTNYWYYTSDSGVTWQIVYLCFLTNVTQLNSNYISSFTPFGPDISLTTNDIRLITHWNFPGKWRTNITPTNGGIYTAPGDGWFYLSVNRTEGTSDAYAMITGWETNYKVTSSCPSVDGNSSTLAAVIMPVSTGCSVIINFSGTVNECAFYYCNGGYIA